MARDVQRSVLPIPDQPGFGLVTYDVQIDLGDDSHDHLIDMAEVIKIAMATQ